MNNVSSPWLAGVCCIGMFAELQDIQPTTTYDHWRYVARSSWYFYSYCVNYSDNLLFNLFRPLVGLFSFMLDFLWSFQFSVKLQMSLFRSFRVESFVKTDSWNFYLKEIFASFWNYMSFYPRETNWVLFSRSSWTLITMTCPESA